MCFDLTYNLGFLGLVLRLLQLLSELCQCFNRLCDSLGKDEDYHSNAKEHHNQNDTNVDDVIDESRIDLGCQLCLVVFTEIFIDEEEDGECGVLWLGCLTSDLPVLEKDILNGA